MVEGARLESVFRGNSNGGSNPLLSANVLIKKKNFSIKVLHLCKKYAKSKVSTHIYGGINGRKEKESNTARIGRIFY